MSGRWRRVSHSLSAAECRGGEGGSQSSESLQVVRVLDLSPGVQEAILLGEVDMSKRRLRGVLRIAERDDQARVLGLDTPGG